MKFFKNSTFHLLAYFFVLDRAGWICYFLAHKNAHSCVWVGFRWGLYRNCVRHCGNAVFFLKNDFFFFFQRNVDLIHEKSFWLPVCVLLNFCAVGSLLCVFKFFGVVYESTSKRYRNVVACIDAEHRLFLT